MDTKAAHELLPKASAQTLLRLNILAIHPNGTYTFETHHVEAYIKKAQEEAAARAERRWW